MPKETEAVVEDGIRKVEEQKKKDTPYVTSPAVIEVIETEWRHVGGVREWPHGGTFPVFTPPPPHPLASQ